MKRMGKDRTVYIAKYAMGREMEIIFHREEEADLRFPGRGYDVFGRFEGASHGAREMVDGARERNSRL